MFGGGLAAGWWQVDGWLTAGGGWRELASVQGGRRTFQSLRSSSIGPYCRSKQSFQASVGGWRRALAVAGGWLAFLSLRSSSIGPYCRSKQSFQASIQGGRLAAGARGRQQEGNSAVALSMKRQKRLPILKTPGHRAQKPHFVLKTPENGGSGS